MRNLLNNATVMDSISDFGTSGVQTSLAWKIDDAGATRELILANLGTRSAVLDLMLGFVARNFQGRAFSVRSLRNALGLDASVRVGEKNNGDKISNLLYDATRRGHTKGLVANVGEYEGVTHYSLTEAGWEYYKDSDAEVGLRFEIEPVASIGERDLYHWESPLSEPVINPLSRLAESSEPTTLTLPEAIEAIRKLNAKVKTLENTVNELYDQNIQLVEQLELANTRSVESIELAEDVKEILRDLL